MKKKSKIKINRLFIVIGLTLATIIYVKSRSEVMHTSLELARQIATERELKKENKQLKIKLEQKMTPAKIEQLVSKQLDLVEAKETQVVIFEEKN